MEASVKQAWFEALIGAKDQPLFLAKDNKVAIRTMGIRSLVCRSPEMEANIISECDKLRQNGEEYEGILTLAYHRIGKVVKPFFSASTETYGRDGQTLSRNLSDCKANRSHNFFARWGDDIARHFGELSDAMFPSNGRKVSKAKQKWINALFDVVNGEYNLKQSIYFVAKAWEFGNLDFNGNKTYLTDLVKLLNSEAKRPSAYWENMQSAVNAIKKVVGCFI